MELDALSQPDLERIERIGSADVAVGVLDLERQEDGASAVSMTREALADLSRPLRAIVLSNALASNGTHGAAQPAQAGAGVIPAEAEVMEDKQSLAVYSCTLGIPSSSGTLQQSISQAYRSIFSVGSKLGVRACGVITSHSQPEARLWIYRLVQPVLELGFDLVAPCYTRHKMEGLLNRSVLAPLHRALYGEQLQNPLGPDFGLSGKLLQQILKQAAGRRNGVERSALASIAATAASGSFQVCESHLGARTQRPTDWGNLSSLLAEVLGAMFLEMESRAAHWQSVRGSKELPRFGTPEALSPETGNIDVHGMLESFHLGTQNLQDVWGLLLPPTSLLELKRLSRLPENQFRVPDQLWVRIIYDFALGHRLQTISRDHLLRSITPLYLGWIASYAQEMQAAGPAEVDARIERLAKAYEDNKSYLVSRWRWPDRFNP